MSGAATGISLAIELTLQALDAARRYQDLVARATAEGRDISPEELAEARSHDDAARKDQADAIARAEARERGATG